MARFEPLWQQAGSYPAQLDRFLLGAMWPSGGVSGGVVTAAFNTMNVNVTAGFAAVPLQAGQGSALCRWDAAEVVTLTASPPTGQSRIDVIIAQVRDNAIDGGANNDFIFSAVAGTPAASNPAVPATPTNALALANVTVPGGAANLNAAPITSLRPPLGPALGRVAEAYGPAANTAIAQGTTVTIATLTFQAVAGRRYRISGYGTGQQSGTGIANNGAWAAWSLVDEGGIVRWITYDKNFLTNSWCAGAIAYQFVNTGATRMVTYLLQGRCDFAGWLQVGAGAQSPLNGCWLIAEDIGPV